MRSTARESAAKGIRVNTMLPGPAGTDMYLTYPETKADTKGTEQEHHSQLIYPGDNEPPDAANAIAFLLSAASGQITGAALPVDAGFTSC